MGTYVSFSPSVGSTQGGLLNVFPPQEGARTFDNGIVVFSFDEVLETQYTNAFPLFQARGIKGTVNIIGNLIGTNATYLTWEQIRTMRAAGMEIGCHTVDHTLLDSTNQADTLKKLTDNDALFLANGLPKPKTLAYPGGNYNLNTKQWIRDSGLRLSCRGIIGASPIYRDSDRMNLPAFSIDNVGDASFQFGGVNGLDYVKKYIDYTKHKKSALILYMHNVDTTGAVRTIHPDRLAAIMDYCIAQGLTIKTQYELTRMLWDNPTLETTTFTLTARGTGQGVARLDLKPAEDMIFTLTGNARFYTDAAGTQNESTTWNAQAFTTDGTHFRTIYIKCPSGTSNMTFQHKRVAEWRDWVVDGNCPLLGGDASVMEELTYCFIKGTNGCAVTYPNVTNIKRLSVLSIISGSAILTSANVNQILADMVANKDFMKSAIDGGARTLFLSSTAGTGAPTGQGVTDKAALQAYKSPDNKAYNLVWTITTR